MATLFAGSSAATSLFCRPEEDPFLLLESTLRTVVNILQRRRGLPLCRTWIAHPYGGEEITLLEEEVIPALLRLKERVDEIDDELEQAYERGYEAHRLDQEERAEELAQHRYEFSP